MLPYLGAKPTRNHRPPKPQWPCVWNSNNICRGCARSPTSARGSLVEKCMCIWWGRLNRQNAVKCDGRMFKWAVRFWCNESSGNSGREIFKKSSGNSGREIFKNVISEQRVFSFWIYCWCRTWLSHRSPACGIGEWIMLPYFGANPKRNHGPPKSQWVCGWNSNNICRGCARSQISIGGSRVEKCMWLWWGSRMPWNMMVECSKEALDPPIEPIGCSN
jgi:predicted Fe-S protein YdhL (DUF1289 family)